MGRHGPIRAALALGALAALAVGALWLTSGDAFRVSGGCGFCPPPEPGAGAGWDRECLGWRHRVVAHDAEWDQCVGVPVGPRRCYAYADRPAAPGVQGLAVERVPCDRRHP